MDSREMIIQAAMALIRERGEGMQDITVREICKRAGVGLGLVNYHFGSKDNLIEICVERIINGIVDVFRTIREEKGEMAPFEKLEFLGNMTLTFLFDHEAVSRISMLTDLRMPKADDNTHRTYMAYLPLVAACRPDWDKAAVKRKTFCLIAAMQESFLRHREILEDQGIDLTQKEERMAFHAKILHDILEV